MPTTKKVPPKARPKKTTPEANRSEQRLDASSTTLGRLATQAARFLMGKHKPTYQLHIDAGDFVTVTNVAKLHVTGNKLVQKTYKHYSGYPGGLKERQLKDVIAKNPAWVVRQAVWNMLPKNKLRSQMIKRLKVTV